MSETAQNQQNSLPTPLFGHRDILEKLYAGFQQNKLHHGWILSGDEGIGKSRLARQIAAWILSVRPDSDNALFGSEDILPDHPSELALDGEEARLVFANAHPDLLLIQPEEEEKNKSGLIKAEQIRKLPAFFAHHSARSKWRVAIIDNLDVVNRAGMNAMLKTLEEPPNNCLLLLISSRPGQVLPTIKSRCITANLSPLSRADTIGVLRTIWPDADMSMLEILAGVSKGAPGRALQLAEAGVLDLFETSCRILSDARAKPADIIKIAEKWAAGGVRGRPARQAASYLFAEILSLASLYSLSASTALQNSFASIPFIEEAARTLASHHSAERLAVLHGEFTKSYQQNEQLYLDFAPVMTKFFFDLHSQSAKR